MSDARLRALERRFRASGSVEDHAAYLVARVHAGQLTHRRLEIAAWVEHEGAERALLSPELDPDQVAKKAFEQANQRFDASPGDALILDLDPRGSLANWLGKLGRMDPIAGHRAAAAAAQALFDAGAAPDSTRPVLRAFEAWVLAPNQRNRAELTALAEPNQPLWIGHLIRSTDLKRPTEAAAARFATECCVHDHPRGDRAIRPAIRDELSLWALGDGDPLWSRLQVRKGNIKITPEDLGR